MPAMTPVPPAGAGAILLPLARGAIEIGRAHV